MCLKTNLASKVYIFFAAFKICLQKDKSLRKDWIDSCEKAKKRSRTFCIHGIDFVHCGKQISFYINRLHFIFIFVPTFSTRNIAEMAQNERIITCDKFHAQHHCLSQGVNISVNIQLDVNIQSISFQFPISNFQLFRLLFASILLEIFSLKLFPSIIKNNKCRTNNSASILHEALPLLFGNLRLITSESPSNFPSNFIQ